MWTCGHGSVQDVQQGAVCLGGQVSYSCQNNYAFTSIEHFMLLPGHYLRLGNGRSQAGPS